MGWIPYNHTHQKRDPEGGRKGTQHVPQAEWADTRVPELQIISDELWTKAHSYNKAVTRPAGWLGGWKRGDSIFSSVLRCTSCPSGSIVIVQKQGRPGKPQKSLYGCGNHFRTGSCPNGVTIERNYLEHELLTAITDRLSAPDLAPHMLAGFKFELEKGIQQRLQEREEILATVPELLDEKRRVEGAISNLLALGERCAANKLDLIGERLNQHQARLQAIDGLLQQPELSLPEIPEEEISAFIHEKRANLVELLLKDRSTAQFAVHKYIERLEVTPQGDGSICVEGRVKLFDRTDVETYPDLGRKAGSSTFMDASASTTWQIHVCLNLRPPKKFLGPRVECDPPCPVCILVGIKPEEEKQFKYTNLYKLIDGFELAPPGVPSLAEYCAKKNPVLPNERFLVVSAWIQRYAGLPHFTASHLYTCFVALGWKTQKYMVQLPRLNPALYESPGYGKWRLKEPGLIAAGNLNSETENEPSDGQRQSPQHSIGTAPSVGSGALPRLP